MSKKYKLIKTYPGSPELGTTASYNKGCCAIEFKSTKGEIHYFGSSKDNFFENLVINQPEFWEEVVEKDYEILSFKTSSGELSLLQSNGNYFIKDESDYIKFDPDGYFRGFTVEEELDHKSKIHSVKRLSDGEIFTVGDEIIFIDIFPKKVKIKSIQLFNDEILIHKDCTMDTNKLSEIKHCKQPLFTTEDGVGIYEGDRVSTVLLSIMELFTIDGSVGSSTRPAEGFKYFSTKEKAEEYILMNKPCLSVADIWTYFYGQLSGCSNLFYLKKLAKSKLNESKD